MTIAPAFAVQMARYNAWQNANLYGAAAGLTEAARRQDRGAFFGSIHDTLGHVLWADRMWLSRLTDAPAPSRDTARAGVPDIDWDALRDARDRTDAEIHAWAEALTEADLDRDLTWRSGLSSAELTEPMPVIVIHLFNHQTHHRGQVHAMLTAAGAVPHETDFAWLPDPKARS